MSNRAAYLEDVKTHLPGPKAEGWRYADLSLLRTENPPLADPSDISEKPGSVSGWPTLIIGNGKPIQKPENLKGVEISLHQNGKGGTIKDTSHPLAGITAAHAQSGVQIRLSKKTSLEGLEIIFLEEGPAKGTRHLLNRIILEAGAKATLFIRTLNRRKNGWVNSLTHVSVGAGAHLSLAHDFEAEEKTLTSGFLKAEVAESARFQTFTLGMGVPSLRFETEVTLGGKNASAELNGGLLAGAHETIDLITRIHHATGGTQSRQLFKGAAGTNGVTAFQGKVVVEKDAQKIEAHQNCHNLILAEGGEANVKPELLIYADDVVCSHGATVGEVDETALFYLMQRGIPEKEARAILVEAFLGEVLEKAGGQTLAGHFEARVGAWMAENVV